MEVSDTCSVAIENEGTNTGHFCAGVNTHPNHHTSLPLHVSLLVVSPGVITAGHFKFKNKTWKCETPKDYSHLLRYGNCSMNSLSECMAHTKNEPE